MKILSFSEPFLEAMIIEKAADYTIDEESILLNIDENDIHIEGKDLKQFGSSIYSNIVLPRVDKLIQIKAGDKLFGDGPYAHWKEIVDSWQHVYDIFPLPHLKKVNLWKSKQDMIGNIGLNFWYAKAGTDCGIHNKHDFREIHTQAYGIGRMQKFKENDFKTLYQDVFMSPGYTHDPFYDESGTYPWHQYKADTDCIWLAIEVYE